MLRANKELAGAGDPEAEPYSIRKYVPPRWNSQAGKLEMHLPLNNYAGPGTDVHRRWVQESMYGTNPVDNAARHHDIEYSNLGTMRARGLISQTQLEKGVANSDAGLLKVARNHWYGINPLTVASAHAVNAGITLKRGAQWSGLLNKAAFTTSDPKRALMDVDRPKDTPALPANYLQGGRKPPKKVDRLERLKQLLK